MTQGPERVAHWLVMVVFALVVAGCGATDDQASPNRPQASATSDTDSSPGQTASQGDEPPEATTSSVDAGSAVPEPGQVKTTTITNDDNGGSGAAETMTGAAVSAAKGFSEFSGRRVGLIASRASVVQNRSTIDLLAEADDIDLVAIFAPEHSIRADLGAGLKVEDEVDPVTGLPVHSLYGSTPRPTPEMLVDIDLLVFDLQDVGTRFYTYTSTMGLAMQSAAEAGIPFLVLDRPNPIGGRFAAGRVRDDDQVSFVSQYPIPSIHGMTAAELALAIRGERWLTGLDDLDLQVVELSGWSRDQLWSDTGLPWVAPSPGLPTPEAALIYPATVLFEATTLSFGRGTDHPFQQIGAPWLDGPALAASLNEVGLPGVSFRPVTFTPRSGPAAADPQFQDHTIPGVRIELAGPEALDQSALGIHLLSAVMAQAGTVPQPIEVIDRPSFFDLLAGSAETRRALDAGRPVEAIVANWATDLEAFEQVRSRYLLY